METLMNTRVIPIILAAAVACGCSPKPNKAEPAAPASQVATKLSITGPKGKLSLGDSLDQAKKAFPPPAGAEVFDTSLSFAIAGQKGWAWQNKEGTQAFEVMLRDGKVAAVSVTRQGDYGPLVTLAELEWGPPTNRSKGKNAMAESWISGDLARMAVTSNLPGVGKVGYLLLGCKSDLKLLMHNPDDPGAFVKQMDMAGSMAKALEPVFKDAKRRAMEKAGKKP